MANVTQTEIVASAEVERQEAADHVALGRWYFIDSEDDDGKVRKWFCCVVRIGSNYAKLESPDRREMRLHVDNWHELEPCDHAQKYLTGKIDHYKKRVQKLIGKANDIAKRLGVSEQLALTRDVAAEPQTALATFSGLADTKQYERALVKAKDKQLPAIFSQIRDANESLAEWMKGEMLPQKATVETLQGSIEAIEARIFNVSLYAGLTEDVTQIVDGKPAKFLDRLHLMQRRLYMDEECLLKYECGGMEFKNIKEFDAWLARPDNLNRVLPFPRCAVAFRVRRKTKEREVTSGPPLAAAVRMWLEESDERTYLYLRNGEQLSRMDCDLDFGEMTFPNRDLLNLTEPMMFKMFVSRVDNMITRREWEDRRAAKAAQLRASRKWQRENPDKDWYDNPHGDRDIHLKDYEPFDPSSVYFDDVTKHVTEQVDKYNRIALIVQGLFDRSPVLHPHPPVQLWDVGGFDRAVELVYDASEILAAGEAPDFEAYRARLNASLEVGSVAVGQDDAWEVREGERESTRMDNDWRTKTYYRPKRYRPHGDPGPGILAIVSAWQPRARKATFRWLRERRARLYRRSRYGDDDSPVSCTIRVPAAELLNVSAYKPGDFIQFFEDPRTRAQYLRWAPLLLAAEEYHAGNLKPGDEEEE